WSCSGAMFPSSVSSTYCWATSRRWPPYVKFYQRLLARDPDEATELAEEYLEEEQSLGKLFDSVILPALGLAEQDRLRGSLDRETVQGIAEDTIDIIDDLAGE